MAKSVKETPETTNENVIKEEPVNNEILELLKTMQKQLAESEQKQKDLQKKLDEVEKNNTQPPVIIEKGNDEYIKIIHLLQGGTSLESATANIRFEELFETWDVQKTALKEMVKNQAYKKIFQDVGIYICDKKFIKEVNLEKYYEKYQVNENTFVEMLDMDYSQLQSKLSTLPEDLQYSFKIFVIDEHKSGNSKAESRTVLDALSAFFKTDIYNSLR